MITEDEIKLMVIDIYKSTKDEIERLNIEMSEYELREVVCTMVETILDDADPCYEHKMEPIYDSMVDYFEANMN